MRGFTVVYQKYILPRSEYIFGTHHFVVVFMSVIHDCDLGIIFCW